MNRQIALLTTMMAGAAWAQTTATSTTTIGEVTLTKPVTAPAASQAATEQVEQVAPVPTSTATQTTVEPITVPQPPQAPAQQVPVQEQVAPAQPLQPAVPPVRTVTPPSSANSTSSVTSTSAASTPATPRPAASAATTTPAPQPAPKPAPVPAPKPAPAQAAPAAPKPAAAPATPAQAAPAKPAATSTTAKPATPAKPVTSAVAQAAPTAAPSNLPAGWRHLSGDIFGSKAVTLPAGSKVQVAIEAVNRTTGQHIPHLLVDFGAQVLPTEYYINYNPARMNTAKYDYVIQAKVFSADGEMLYMSDARQPLPRDVAAKLKIDMRF